MVLPTSESYHIRKVLRGQCEDTIILLDGKGSEAVAKIMREQAATKEALISCQIVNKKRYVTPEIRCMLYICPPRSQGIRRIIRQAVELGVAEIIPLRTHLSVSKPDKKSWLKWQADAKEACKQSGNPFLPEIHQPVSINHVLTKDLEPGIIGVVAHSCSGEGRIIDIEHHKQN